MSYFSGAQLRIPVQFGEKLLPIELPEKEDYKLDDGTTCYVTGWRHTLVGSVSDVINKIKLSCCQ